MQTQSTNNILMIRPKNFRFNPETAGSNAFQDASKADIANSQLLALEEFERMIERLKMLGVNVFVYDDQDLDTPDSVFPNNWISFHHSGKVILYPMLAENRRKERRTDIVEDFKKKFHVEVVLDFTHFEDDGKYLEGTGSIVLDRVKKIAYACLSERTNMEVLTAWEKQMNAYKLVTFSAFGSNGLPVYHTNVMMCVGQNFAIICLDAIKDLDERFAVKSNLEKSGKFVVEITLEQMESFAGNALEVKTKNGNLIIMSSDAYYSLTRRQTRSLEEYGELHHFNLNNIEACGGGSARCMMTEIHLPLKK